jgi:hypothetical protein
MYYFTSPKIEKKSKEKNWKRYVGYIDKLWIVSLPQKLKKKNEKQGSTMCTLEVFSGLRRSMWLWKDLLVGTGISEPLFSYAQSHWLTGRIEA